MAVQIRVAQPSDAAEILKIYAPFCESTRVSFEVVPPSLEEMRERIVRITATYPWLVAENRRSNFRLCVWTRLRERAAYQWAVEVAVYISPDYQRTRPC